MSMGMNDKIFFAVSGNKLFFRIYSEEVVVKSGKLKLEANPDIQKIVKNLATAYKCGGGVFLKNDGEQNFSKLER